MRCAECDCVSGEAPGWVAQLGTDSDNDDPSPEVVAFCPPCAAREFRTAARAAEGYV